MVEEIESNYLILRLKNETLLPDSTCKKMMSILDLVRDRETVIW